jgi:hypothetical protein
MSCYFVIVVLMISIRDDVIAIKSGIDYCGRQYNRPSENITISNCVFGTGHGISIGSEMSGIYLLFLSWFLYLLISYLRWCEECGRERLCCERDTSWSKDQNTKVQKKRNKHKFNLPFDSRGRGGIVENILFSNISISGSGVNYAVYINMFYDTSIPPTNATATPIFRNVTLRDIQGDATNAGMHSLSPSLSRSSYEYFYVWKDLFFLHSSLNFTSIPTHLQFQVNSYVFPNLHAKILSLQTLTSPIHDPDSTAPTSVEHPPTSNPHLVSNSISETN